MDEDISVPTKNEKKAITEAMHYAVGQVCQEVGTKLQVQFSAPVMAAVADIAISQLDVYAQDLAAFAKHAKRSAVSTEDVKLLVRRNPSLKAHIESKAAQWDSDVPEKKEKKKRASKKQKEASSSPTRVVDDETSKHTDAENAMIVDADVGVARRSSDGQGGVEKTTTSPNSSTNDPGGKWPNFHMGFDDFDALL